MGPSPTSFSSVSLFPQIPKLVCPSQRPHVVFATRTNRDCLFVFFVFVFDAPDERARRSALQTHVPSQLVGVVPSVLLFTLLGIETYEITKRCTCTHNFSYVRVSI